VSYCPEEDLVWLGDDTRQALENLLVGKLVGYGTRRSGCTVGCEPRRDGIGRPG